MLKISQVSIPMNYLYVYNNLISHKDTLDKNIDKLWAYNLGSNARILQGIAFERPLCESSCF